MDGRTRRGAVTALVALSVLLVGALLTWIGWDRGQGEVVAADESSPTAAVTVESPSPAAEGVSDDEATTTAAQVSAEGAEPRAGVASEVPPSELRTGGPAEALVEPVFVELTSALGTPTEVDWRSVVSVADDSLLDSIESAVLEYTENGWTQVGAPSLVSAEVLEMEEGDDGQVARVEVCLDHSEVDVLDGEGASLIDGDAEMRVRSILTMHFRDDRWVATQQDFTDELAC